MDNGCSDGSNLIVWDFDWSDIPDATEYLLQVIGSGATIPVINNSSVTSSYHHESNGFIASGSTYTWKVHANIGGEWQDWSEVRTFNVEPVDTDCP